MFGKDWKTSVLGMLVIVVSVGNIAIKFLTGQPITAEDLAVLGVGTATGGGLYVAKDA